MSENKSNFKLQKIKLDEITEIEFSDGYLIINQYDNNQVILSRDDLIKIIEDGNI